MAYLNNGDPNFATDIAVRTEEAIREITAGIFWKTMIGDVDFGKDENQGFANVNPTGMPIERRSSFTTDGGQTSMLIPFLDKLAIDPKYGDTKLLGTGSSLNYRWLEVYINSTRHAVVAKEGVMSGFRMAYMKNIDKAKQELTDLFTRLKNATITSAFYDGVSHSIAAGLGVSKNGIGCIKRLHPNSYYSNAGTSITEIGTAGYTKMPSEYTSAISSLSTTGKMTFKVLVALASACRLKKIPKVINAHGESFWMLVVHSEQMADLKADADFLTNERAVLAGGEDRLKNPITSNVVTYCAEFAIYSDNTVVREWTTANKFGKYWDEVATTATNFCALVIGKSAVGYADPVTFSMTYEAYDYDAVLEFGGSTIDGANRNDFVSETYRASVFAKGQTTEGYIGDDTTSKYPLINQSSLVLMTL